MGISRFIIVLALTVCFAGTALAQERDAEDAMKTIALVTEFPLSRIRAGGC